MPPPRTSPVPRAQAATSASIEIGPERNELLTSLTGGALIVLLAVLGVTLIALRPMLWLHFFIGLVLVGPLALKLASTGYRFMKYYTHNPPYRLKGPPPIVLRVLAPFVILSTVAVMATGIALLFAGPGSRHSLLPLHKVSFFAWLGFMGVHVLGHLPGLGRALRVESTELEGLSNTPGGALGRRLALAGMLLAGVVLALAFLPEYAPWLHTPAHGDH